MLSYSGGQQSTCEYPITDVKMEQPLTGWLSLFWEMPAKAEKFYCHKHVSNWICVFSPSFSFLRLGKILKFPPKTSVSTLIVVVLKIKLKFPVRKRRENYKVPWKKLPCYLCSHFRVVFCFLLLSPTIELIISLQFSPFHTKQSHITHSWQEDRAWKTGNWWLSVGWMLGNSSGWVLSRKLLNESFQDG